MAIILDMAIKERVNLFEPFHFTKVLMRHSLNEWASLSNILHATINFSSSYNIDQIR